ATRDGDGNISRMGFAPSQENFWLYGTMFGGTFFDDATNTVTANAPNNVAALEWLRTHPEKYDPGKLAAFQEGLANERAQNLDPLISGKYALQLQGPWKL